MNSASSDMPSTWVRWAQLVRLPTVFTVIANVAAAFLLVSGGPQPIARLVCVVLAGIALYWAGMVFNDVFDIERDRIERPQRPLPAGWIPLSQARLAGGLLLIVGVALATLSGYLPSQDYGSSWLPAVIGVGLASLILAYDGPLKQTPLAPAAMGGCRMLSFLLGAAACTTVPQPGELWFPKYLLAIALGFGLYIMGVTTMARDEASEQASPHLFPGFLLTIIGAALLAFAPRTAVGNPPWHLPPSTVFPIMIGLIVFPVIMRGLRVITAPTSVQVQNLIRISILTVIPLAAAFACLGAGPLWGLAMFALAVPSIALSRTLRVT